jgi:thioredoxin-like negative regulator of GroEL
MRVPARLLTMLAFAAAAHAAAASDRFVPADPAFVVANVGRAAPDAALRARVVAWQQDPADEAASVALAEIYFERAHSTREPMFIGRAEAVLASPVAAGLASAAQRRLYAEALQFRHDFSAAETLLDGVLANAPRDTAARSQRASVRLVRGDFAGARSDCARLVASGDVSAAIGIACLAEALAGSGDLPRGRALLATWPTRADMNAAAHAYLLNVRAELAERAGSNDAAIADYREALTLAPESDAIRAALADALLARGDRAAAFSCAEIERPSLAILVRQSLAADAVERSRLRPRAENLLALEHSRGDAAHNREAAMLALDAGQIDRALAAARTNFETQRELPDVRILARAAVRARDAGARQALREWLDSTGFDDVVTESILAGAGRG